MPIEDTLKYMLVFFQDIDKKVNELNDKLSIADIKQQEVLHYIENNNLNASQSCRAIKILKNIRAERREIKNELEVMYSLKHSFADKYKNKFIEKDIIQAIKNLKELKIRQENPKYNYKYLTEELEIKWNTYLK